MCHIVLLMPVTGVGLFWILPMSIALPLYLVILVLSGVVYYALMQAMNEPVRTGRPGLRAQPVRVVKKSGRYWIVETRGELWQADSDDYLVSGQRAVVDRVNGMRLYIHSNR